MKRNIQLYATLVEQVRDLSALGAYGMKGRMNINEALGIVADKYKISTNPEDYEFIVLKALHADEPNNNGDCFTLDELKRFDEKLGCRVYQSFVLKPHFIEHKQDKEVYGFILDAHLEESPKDKNENSYVELIIAVDTTKDPFYGARIKSGKLGKYSMGCSVGYTVCRVCGNKAVSYDDFCDHIKNHKMEKFKVADDNGNEQEILAYEECYEVVYDEISDVADPADPDALEQERLRAASRKSFRKVAQNSWEKMGFTAKEAENWKSAGFDNPDDVIPWRKIGLDAETSMSWLDNGFTLASQANRWILAGFSAMEAGKWKKAGWKNPLKAVRWRNENYEPDSAMTAYDAGYNPEEEVKYSYGTIKKKNKSGAETSAPAAIPAIPPRRKLLKERMIGDMKYPERLRGLRGSKRKGQAPMSKKTNFNSVDELEREVKKGLYFGDFINVGGTDYVMVEYSGDWQGASRYITFADEDTLTKEINIDYKEAIVNEDVTGIDWTWKGYTPRKEPYKSRVKFENVQARNKYPERLRGLRGNKRKGQVMGPVTPTTTDTAPTGQEKERGWLINLAEDVKTKKVTDEYSAKEWFKNKYNRDPNPGEVDNMRNLFGSIKEGKMSLQRKPLTIRGDKLSKAVKTLKRLGNNANYFLWRSKLRRLGFSPQDIKSVEQEGTKRGLWTIFDDEKSSKQKPAKKSSRRPLARRQLRPDTSKDARTYYVKSVKRSASDIRYPGLKDWKLTIKNFGRRLIATLGNDTEAPFKKVLSRVNEKKFAEAVLGDLLKNGMSFVVKKYGFTPRFKAISEDGMTSLAPGEQKTRFTRVTENGDTDKGEYNSARYINDAVTDEGSLDKEGKRKRRVGRKPLKAKRKYGLKYLKVGKLAKAVLDYYKKYEKLNDKTAKGRVIELFVGDKWVKGANKKKAALLRRKAQEGEMLESVIDENVEVVDVPGLAEEVIEYMVTDEEMTPVDVAVEFTDNFVVEEAPEEVIDEIKEQVEDKAEEVQTEAPGEEVSPPAEEIAEIKDDVEDLEKETPSMDEMGVEELEVASSRKAKEMNEFYKKKFIRALKVTATRQILNIEPEGFFDIKAAICDYLVTPQGKFAGIKPDIAASLINQAFMEVRDGKYLDDLFASAEQLADMPDEAFVRIEADVKNLKPVDVSAVSSESEKRVDRNPIFAKTGTELLKDDEALVRGVRASLPSFGFERR